MKTVARAAAGVSMATLSLCVGLSSVVLSLSLAGPVVAAAGLKAVVFDLEPVGEPFTPAIRARLKAESDLVRNLLADRGYIVVDTGPQAAKIKDNLPLSQCNGCDQDIAKALGADVEVTTAVQPSSSVIFNLSGNVKDVQTNRVLREGVVDIRGEGEDVWSHGIKFLVKERLLDPPLPTDPPGLRRFVDALPKTPD